MDTGWSLCIWQIIPDDGVEVTTKKGVIEKLVGITSPAATTWHPSDTRYSVTRSRCYISPFCSAILKATTWHPLWYPVLVSPCRLCSNCVYNYCRLIVQHELINKLLFFHAPCRSFSAGRHSSVHLHVTYYIITVTLITLTITLPSAFHITLKTGQILFSSLSGSRSSASVDLATQDPGFPHLLESPGFFLENSRTWKVPDNQIGSG